MRYLPDLAWLVDWHFLMVLMAGGIIKFTFSKETHVKKILSFEIELLLFKTFFTNSLLDDAFSVRYLTCIYDNLLRRLSL